MGIRKNIRNLTNEIQKLFSCNGNSGDVVNVSMDSNQNAAISIDSGVSTDAAVCPNDLPESAASSGTPELANSGASGSTFATPNQDESTSAALPDEADSGRDSDTATGPGQVEANCLPAFGAASICRFAAAHEQQHLVGHQLRWKRGWPPNKRTVRAHIVMKMVAPPPDEDNLMLPHDLQLNNEQWEELQQLHVPAAPALPIGEEEQHLTANAILQRVLIDNDALPALMDNGYHTAFTLFAERNRLDVVQAMYRHQMWRPVLTDLASVSIHRPNPRGHTCLFYFAANSNLDGVRFCVLLGSDSNEAWSAAVMSALTAAAWPQPRWHGDLADFLELLLQDMATALPGSVADVLNNHSLPWTRLCPWLHQHELGQSLLHFACRHCGLSHVQQLLRGGADPTLPTADGRHRSAFDVCGEFQAEPLPVAQLMVQACALHRWDFHSGIAHLAQWMHHRQLAFNAADLLGPHEP